MVYVATRNSPSRCKGIPGREMNIRPLGASKLSHQACRYARERSAEIINLPGEFWVGAILVRGCYGIPGDAGGMYGFRRLQPAARLGWG